MSAPTGPTPPPEAVLIRRAREAMGISPETAAPRTGMIKASQWRNIESGKATARDGVLAHMARVVDVRASELADAGREEAAEILRRLEREDRPRDDLDQRPGESGPAYLQRMIAEFVKEHSPEEQALRTILESWKRRDAG